MDRPVRIGVAGVDDRSLREALRALPSHPDVHVVASLYDEIEGLVALRPDVLFLGVDDGIAELLGALRLLRGLLPGTGLVLVAPVAREVQMGPLLERTGARLLLLPLLPGAVASVLEQALTGSDRPRDEVFLDLARGFADEVNNPLLFLTGHLQLLQSSFDPVADRDRRDQVTAALGGAQRIQALVGRIQQLSKAAGGPRRSEEIDLAGALAGALAGLEPREEAPTSVREPEAASFSVRGDPDLLGPAIVSFVHVAAELQQLRCRVHFVLSRLQGAVRLRLQVTGGGLAEWRLPRTFEPYYLNRLLRGTSQGLSLFLVQTTVHGHGGQATARRLPDDALALDLSLPAD